MNHNLKVIYIINYKMEEENSPQPSTNELRLVDIQVTDENTALNLMVSFLHMAQKRGAFTLDESAKIWECIKQFQR